MSRDQSPFSLCLEAVPPLQKQGEEGIEQVLAKVDAIHSQVPLHGVNIPEIREESSKSDKGERLQPFEPRVEPRELARRIKDRFGLECMINRVVVHLTPEKQADWFRETWEEYGVRQFVLVGGEDSSVDYPGPNVPQANQLIRETLTDPALKVGNICIPTREGEANRLFRKIDSGADFFTTQIVYHPEEFTRLLDALAEYGDHKSMPEMLLTVTPIKSARNIKFLHWLGVNIEPELENWLTEDPDRVPNRAQEHIENAWQTIETHRRSLATQVPVGINLAPIGKIPNEMTVDLAQRLKSVAERD
jgi:5,10-methylenetetrahydrofolate reductase